MTPAGRQLLADGAASIGVPLSNAHLDQFERLAASLRHWNRRINLTAITDETGIIVRHFLDSLTIVPHLPADTATLLDLGSGAGFPALPVAIVRPDVQVVSVDAVQKKIHFQRHVARELGLTNLVPRHARAEALVCEEAERYPLIVLRAVAELGTLVQLAVPLLAPGGLLLAMKGQEAQRELAAAADVLAASQLTVLPSVSLVLPATGDQRSLLFIKKL